MKKMLLELIRVYLRQSAANRVEIVLAMTTLFPVVKDGGADQPPS